MAQHDQVIDNATGLVVRKDINGALAALYSSSMGPIEPQVIVPGQLWYDTGVVPPVLRFRKQSNTGWIALTQGEVPDADLSLNMMDGATERGRIEAAGGAAAALLTMTALDNTGTIRGTAKINTSGVQTDRQLAMIDASAVVRYRWRPDLTNNRLYMDILDATSVVVATIAIGPLGLLAQIGGVGIHDTGAFIRTMLTGNRDATTRAVWDVRDATGTIKRQLELTPTYGLRLLDAAGANPKQLYDTTAIAAAADIKASTAEKLIDAAGYVSTKWTSAPITIALSGTGVVTHTLPARPKRIAAYWVFTAAASPFAIGDKVEARNDGISTTAGHGTCISSVGDTQIRYQIGNTSAGFSFTAAGVVATTFLPANGQLVLEAAI